MTRELVAALQQAAANRQAVQDACRAESVRIQAERDANTGLAAQPGQNGLKTAQNGRSEGGTRWPS